MVYLTLVPGSESIDMDSAVLSIDVTGEGAMSDNCIRDVHNSTSDVIAQPDEQVWYHIWGFSLYPGDSVTIRIIPTVGFATLIDFTVPDVLSPGTVMLR